MERANIVMGHAAVTDLSTGDHRFAEIFYRASPMLAGVGTFPDSTIAWARAAPGTTGEWRLNNSGSTFRATAQDQTAGLEMELALQPTKGRVYQGPNGFSKKNASGTAASMYYTFPGWSRREN